MHVHSAGGGKGDTSILLAVEKIQPACTYSGGGKGFLLVMAKISKLKRTKASIMACSSIL